MWNWTVQSPSAGVATGAAKSGLDWTKLDQHLREVGAFHTTIYRTLRDLTPALILSMYWLARHPGVLFRGPSWWYTPRISLLEFVMLAAVTLLSRAVTRRGWSSREEHIHREMAASLAHELNQPLHAVKNYARGCVRRLSKMPARDEELVAALEQISAEASRAAEIVRRVRRFVEKGEPQFSEVFVNNLVTEVLLLSKAELEPRQAKVVLELAVALPPVLGDPIQIEQVIMNLVRNGLEAMDEMPEGDRSLGVKTMLNGGQTVQVEVSDRGKGLDTDHLESVFEPFLTTKPDGMGMGLSISRSIIQAHGGRLWASVNPDQGCTFHFTLPVGERS